MEPNGNTFPLIVAGILGLGIVGMLCAPSPLPATRAVPPLGGRRWEFPLAVFFCLGFSLTFESSGALTSSFALCLTLGTIWNSGAEKLRDLLCNLCVAFVCTGGVWLVFERIFRLSLP